MTKGLFDPRNYSKCSVSERPLMLHFQYSGSDDVFRFVLAERIPWDEITTATRRKKGEGKDEALVRNKYIRDEYK